MSGVRGLGSASHNGQSIAEFALVLPVFLLITVLVIDGARAYMAQISLTNGVREATMFALQGHYGEWCRDPGDPTEADPAMPVSVACPAGSDASNYAPDPDNLAYRIAGETGGLDKSRITLFQPLCGVTESEPSMPCDEVAGPRYVKVGAAYEFDPITPGLAAIWGSSITLHASSTGRIHL